MSSSSFLSRVMHSLLFFGLLLLARSGELSLRPLATNNVIEDECRRVSNATRCQEIAKAVGATNTTDLLTLVNVTIPYAYSVSNETYRYIKDLVHHTRDHALNITYSSCLTFYDIAVGALEQAGEYFRNHDYNGLVSMASGARISSEDCAEGIVTGDPSQLPQKNNYFYDVADFLGRICYDLEQK